jgi:hypothetical protein
MDRRTPAVNFHTMVHRRRAARRRRRCVERGELLAISYQDVKTLYLQSPAFAFYLLRLVSERLFQQPAGARAGQHASPRD